MTEEKTGALALIIGASMYVVVMVFHPSHIASPVVGHLTLNALVHGLALVMVPIMAFGAFSLSRVLDARRPLPAVGLAFYSFGLMGVLIAATMSGLVMPEIIGAAHAPDADPSVSFQQIAMFSGWINQGFAHVHVAFMSLAIVFWSLAWTETLRFRRTLRTLGMICGLGILGWQIFGNLTLDVHGMGVVVFAQSGWTILAGLSLWAGKHRAKSIPIVD